MCGIAGIISKQNATKKNLGLMLSNLVHRGPDGIYGHINENVALGMTRLAIVDIKGGAQPAFSKDRKISLIFNGEIFNYSILKKKLISKGIKFKTNSEVETLLNLYIYYGLSFVEKLNGQFAIAIRDGRSNELHLVRDRFGIRPLFWSKDKDNFIFASEIKSILSTGLIQTQINPQSLLSTIRFWTNIGDITSFNNIKQIPPAHILTLFSTGEIKMNKYWSWNFHDPSKQLKLKSDTEYIEYFKQELTNSISRQRMSDVKVGCYLSGGIDSSIIAYNLNKIEKNLTTYSIRFDDKEYDEADSQNSFIKTVGLKNKFLNISYNDISNIFPKVVWHSESILFRTAPSPLYLLSQMVNKDGVKVVMTGEGADEILLGYDLFRETKIRNFWRKQPDSLNRPKLLQKLYYYLPQYKNPRFFEMIKEFYKPSLLKKDKHYSMQIRWNNGKILEKYLSDNFRKNNSSFNPLQELEKWLPEKYFKVDDIQRAQYIEKECLLQNYLLSSQGDRMSLANSVEGRYPYLDYSFVNFCSKLPFDQKIRILRDKYILRKSYDDKLPKEIINRPKVAYQAPDMIAFFENNKPKDLVTDILTKKNINDLGLFKFDLIEKLIQKGSKNLLSRISMRDNMAFTIILSTMLLNEIFIKNTFNFYSKSNIDSQINFS